MAIQYSGTTPTSTTLTQSAGTRAELASWISDQLVLAGWTVDAGATTDRTLKSSLTPQSLQCRVRSYDPGSGNCARLKWSNPGGTKTQSGDCFLSPAVGKVWRFIGCPFQFAVFVPGPGIAAREFAAGGSPYLPAFLNGVITECLWSQSNGNADADATVRGSFKTRLESGASSGNEGSCYLLANGNAVDAAAATAAASQGVLQLVPVCSAAWHHSGASAYRWHDDSLLLSDPLVAWGLTAVADEAKIRGQLWDALVISDSFLADALVTIDGKTFWCVTDANAGSNGGTARGTLALAVT